MIFAIDSGGTKTKILFASEDGRILDTKVIQGFGLPDDPDDLPIIDLEKALIEMCPDTDEISKVVVNLGGTNTNQFFNSIRSVFHNAEIDIFRESSGVIGNMIRKKYFADIIFFCGTGCIALGKCERGYFVLDGWGKDIGDFGSGYYIGISAIKNSLLELEGKRPLSKLAKLITGEKKPFYPSEKFDSLMKKRDLVRSRIMPLERSQVAAFTKTTFECAKENDSAALEIFNDVGKKIGDMTIRAIEKFDKTTNIRIAFCGGVSATKEFWMNSFCKTISEKNIECETIFPEFDFALGALEYALNREGNYNENSI